MCVCVSACVRVHTHTHTHTYIYIYIYITWYRTGHRISCSLPHWNGYICQLQCESTFQLVTISSYGAWSFVELFAAYQRHRNSQYRETFRCFPWSIKQISLARHKVQPLSPSLWAAFVYVIRRLWKCLWLPLVSSIKTGHINQMSQWRIELVIAFEVEQKPWIMMKHWYDILIQLFIYLALSLV